MGKFVSELIDCGDIGLMGWEMEWCTGCFRDSRTELLGSIQHDAIRSNMGRWIMACDGLMDRAFRGMG